MDESSHPSSGTVVPSDLASPPPPAGHPAHDIFFGADGLRAGWSLLLFSVLFSVLLLLAGINPLRLFITSSPVPSSPIVLSASAMALTDGLLFCAVLLPTLLISRVERRPLRSYGLGRSANALPQLLSGLLSGAILLSVLVGALWASHLLIFTGHLSSSAIIAAQAADFAFSFLLVALFEECFLRGFLQFTLSRGLAGVLRPLVGSGPSRALAFWTIAAALSFLFGFGHRGNPGESPIGLVSAGLIGLVFCLSLWRTGSLWWAVGFHTAWDWAQSFVYGVADSGLLAQFHLLNSHPHGQPLLSGGSTGPEGSLYILFIVALVAGVILLTLGHTGWPVAGSLTPNLVADLTPPDPQPRL